MMVSKGTDILWEKIGTKCNKAVVFIDKTFAEILHWHGGFKRLVDAGAVAVKEFSSFEVRQKTETFSLNRV